MFSKETLQGLPPLLFIGLRFLLAGLVLASISGKNLLELSSDQWRHSSIAGLLFSGAMSFWVMGLYHTVHIGEGAFITSMGIVLVPVISCLLFSDKPAKNTWIAIPVSIIGLACLSLNQTFSFESGQLFFFFAAAIFACHFTVVSKVVINVAPLSLTAIQLVIVGIFTLTLSAIFETPPEQVSAEIWIWFLCSTLIATSLRFWLQTKGQSFAPASHAALILTLEPIWTAVLASIWFKESMTLLQLSGCSLIFSALLISRWRWVKLIFQR